MCAWSSCAASSDTVEPYSHDLSWYDTWQAQHQPAELGQPGRQLRQLGAGYWTKPAGHTGSSSCKVKLVGTKTKWGVKYASVNCTSTDAFWKKYHDGKVQAGTNAPTMWT